MEKDIRWQQRFSNFEKAIHQLQSAIEEHGASPIPIIKEGIIQRFEFTHELAWKVMKDFLEYEGYLNITGPRSATREAFQIGLIQGGQQWMDMLESRNQTVHTYQNAILESEFQKIVEVYFDLLLAFYQTMKQKLEP